jgi:hypothetical protein
MANVDYYQNKLKALIDNPGSFSGTPGFKFAVDTAMDQLGRQNSSIRGSGAALTALSDRAGGMASQNYLQYLTNLGDLSGKEQQYDLGQTRNTNDLTLGTEANRLTGVRDANNYTLGQGRLGLDSRTADQNFGLGMFRANNDAELGHEQNANTAQNNWWNYSLGADRNNNDRAQMENNYNLGQGQNALGWYSARTNRGSARSGSDLGWTKWNATVNPIRRYA